MSQLQNRSELLFLYDVKRCNPNGDPLDANRPRIDEESGRCLVTDVRLKRTVRDYLMTSKGYDGTGAKGDVFIRDIDGKPVTGAGRSAAYEGKEDFCQKFIDVRLFGGVSAPGADKSGSGEAEEAEGSEDEGKTKGKKGKGASNKGKVFHYTGPVQFSMGYSLNKVHENFIKGTGAFATKEGAEQKTFREEYNITYGMIAFHGVVNENAGRHVKTTENDISELTGALWNGTKDLLTRSKKGHMPRLLLKIEYNDGFFIGDLCERLRLVPVDGKKSDALEDVEDYTLDTAALNTALVKHDAKIISVSVEVDERLKLTEPIRIKNPKPLI
jgi:CRISPR-associated protein Csh2